MTHTIKSALAAARNRIGSDSAKLDAELLLARALNKPRSYLFTWPEQTLTTAQWQQFEALLELREQGQPVAHLLGEQEFWSLNFKVSPDTLIPRPETELLVELVLNRLPPEAGLKLADLGTGTGCIAISIAHERPQWQLVAVDRSQGVLDIARKNAIQLGTTNVSFLHASWCEGLAANSLNLIVSNPPYIRADDEHLSQGDVRFEPRSALAAGSDGLDDIRQIAEQALTCLKPGGSLILEFGYDQAADVAHLLSCSGYDEIESHRDFNNIIRAISARKPC